jgi:hypothetical protein
VAPPPDFVAQRGGRRTSARLQVVARRVDAPGALPANPGAIAREAMRAYHAQIASRPLIARLGFFRLAARHVERTRLHDKLVRKSERMRAPVH